MGQCWEILPSPPHPQATLHPCHVHPGSGGLTRFREGLEQQKAPWHRFSALQQAFPRGLNPRWKSRQRSSGYIFLQLFILEAQVYPWQTQRDNILPKKG